MRGVDVNNHIRLQIHKHYLKMVEVFISTCFSNNVINTFLINKKFGKNQFTH